MTEIFMAFSSPQKPKFKQTLTIWPYRSLSKHGFAIVMAVLAGPRLLYRPGLFPAWGLASHWFFRIGNSGCLGCVQAELPGRERASKLTATERELVVENVAPTGEIDIVRMPADWLRVEVTPKTPPEMSARYRQRIYVTSHGRRTEIGGFLHPAETPGLAAELSTMLDNARNARLQAS